MSRPWYSLQGCDDATNITRQAQCDKHDHILPPGYGPVGRTDQACPCRTTPQISSPHTLKCLTDSAGSRAAGSCPASAWARAHPGGPGPAGDPGPGGPAGPARRRSREMGSESPAADGGAPCPVYITYIYIYELLPKAFMFRRLPLTRTGARLCVSGCKPRILYYILLHYIILYCLRA